MARVLESMAVPSCALSCPARSWPSNKFAACWVALRIPAGCPCDEDFGAAGADPIDGATDDLVDPDGGRNGLERRRNGSRDVLHLRWIHAMSDERPAWERPMRELVELPLPVASSSRAVMGGSASSPGMTAAWPLVSWSIAALASRVLQHGSWLHLSRRCQARRRRSLDRLGAAGTRRRGATRSPQGALGGPDVSS